MTEQTHSSGGTGPSHRSVEIAVSVVMALFAVIGLYGSSQVGIGWGPEGPRAGFFPFYISAIVLISCAVNFIAAIRASNDGKLFAEWGQLGRVVSVVIPTAVYVGIIPYLGMYVSSALLVAVFMRWFGKYNWLIVIGIAVIVPVLTFFMFEIWFLVPLPKGPLENYLGY